jgi:hypothetical protein
MMTAQALSMASEKRPLGALQRLRARRRQRGVMFAESLFVLLTMAVFLACTLVFHSAYAAKSETLAFARREAWTQALAGCRVEAADELLERSSEHAALAFGNGAVPGVWQFRTRTIVTCDEPRAGNEASLAQMLDTLYQLVPWRPVDMMRWFFGSELFGGMFGPLQSVGDFLHLAAEEVSNAQRSLTDRLGDVLALTQQALAGAFDWVASLF